MKVKLSEDKTRELKTGVINALLLLAVVGLGVAAFFSLLEILLTFAAQLIVRTVDSQVRGNYALVTVRNLWLIVGGAGLVGFLIYCIDYCFKHWRSARTRRLFLRVLAIELVVIAAQLLIAG